MEIVRFKCVLIPVSDAVIVPVLKDGTSKGDLAMKVPSL